MASIEFMDNQKYRCNHMGMSTTKNLQNEKYLPNLDLYTSGYKDESKTNV